jgi:hypothetical protein
MIVVLSLFVVEKLGYSHFCLNTLNGLEVPLLQKHKSGSIS